jgi:hypothetical protein
MEEASLIASALAERLIDHWKKNKVISQALMPDNRSEAE